MAPEEARVGLLVPSPNTVMERDFYRRLPATTSLHTARMYLHNVDPASQERMLAEEVMPAVRCLASVQPHAVVFGCTSAGALRGTSYDESLCREIESTTGAPTVSVLSAVRAALNRRHAKVVGVLTPYIDVINAKLKLSIEQDGFRVAGICGLGITESRSLAAVPSEEIVRFAIECFEQVQMDVLFVSCTNFRSLDAASDISSALGIPVLTSTLAALESVAELLDLDLVGR